MGIVEQWKLLFIIFWPRRRIVSFSFTWVFSLQPCAFSSLFFLSYAATPIDSAFLISQHNPINLIVIAAINI